ncbi:hypothetical protein [Clostridium novyi]|nr:hypothetical protein [Clostridium novyi]
MKQRHIEVQIFIDKENLKKKLSRIQNLTKELKKEINSISEVFYLKD